MADRRSSRSYHAYCSVHRKVLHLSRKDARRAAKDMREPGLREYPCRHIDGMWHVGHLPEVVRRGELTMTEARTGVGR